jgi:hypothetical protein
VPGRGNQPCAEILNLLGRNGFDGNVVLEINTRRAVGQEAKDVDLHEALMFARRNLIGAHTAESADQGDESAGPGAKPEIGAPAS